MGKLPWKNPQPASGDLPRNHPTTHRLNWTSMRKPISLTKVLKGVRTMDVGEKVECEVTDRNMDGASSSIENLL